ncbi:hypothetical protein [Massilia sp. TWR1-2-2]|uniref:hypothetical protein n=1 Tax=Massilia sp. TWR1-2-2 TaxID=2804584 RepID=UPI003CEFFBCB
MTYSGKTPRLIWTAIVLGTLIVQIALLFFSMPISLILTGAHSFHIDNPFHVYQLEVGKSLLQQAQLLGYDPFLGAGHLGGMNDNGSARVPVFLSALLPASMPTGAVYSLYIFVCALLGPVAVAWMARLLKWSPVHGAVAAAVGLAMWWVGALHWYHTAGMVSFVCGSYLGLPYTAWCWKLCSQEQRNLPGLVGAGVLGGLGMWLHPLFPLLVVALFVGLFIWDRRDAALAAIAGRGVIIGALAVLVNLPGLYAVFGVRDIGANPLMVHPFQKTIGLMVALKPAFGSWSSGSMGTFLNPLLLLACAAGLVWLAPAQRRKMLPLLFAGVALVLFASFGAASSALGQLQPNRYIAPGFMLVGLAAAYCIGEFIVRNHGRWRSWPQLAALAVACVLVLYTGREVVREATPGPHGHYGKAPPEVSAAPALVAQLQSWIAANTTADGRIVFETSLGRVHGGGHVAGLLALRTGREFVGAGYPFSLPALSTWDHVAFGMPVKQLTEADWRENFERYNVGWVIAHSAELKAALSAVPSATAVATFDGVQIYKIERALSYIQAGSGRIAGRGFNRLDVAGAGGPQVVLKYHWLPDLVTTPRRKIEPVELVPGLPPFIRVVDPPSEFTVSMCRGCKPQ